MNLRSSATVRWLAITVIVIVAFGYMLGISLNAHQEAHDASRANCRTLLTLWSAERALAGTLTQPITIPEPLKDDEAFQDQYLAANARRAREREELLQIIGPRPGC